MKLIKPNMKQLLAALFSSGGCDGVTATKNLKNKIYDLRRNHHIS
jgi:hypothetical protein